jgi:hypothetical protein
LFSFFFSFFLKDSLFLLNERGRGFHAVKAGGVGDSGEGFGDLGAGGGNE